MKYKVQDVGTYQVQSENYVYQSELSNKVYVLSLSTNIFRLKDLFQDPSSLGLFKYMSEQDDAWGAFIKSHFKIPTTDVEYIFNVSGEKFISPMIVRFIRESYNGGKDKSYPIKIKWLAMLSELIEQRFHTKWEKLYNSLNFTYDPLRPYDIKITDSNQLESSDTTKDETDSENNNTSTSEGLHQGFNSSEYQPVEKQITADTNKENTIKNRDYTRKENIERDVSRKGNIGNVTFQELIQKERDIYDWQFMNVVFKDLDSILAINFLGGIN